MREFSKSISVSSLLFNNAPDEVFQAAFPMLYKDYSTTKFIYFPSWNPKSCAGELKVFVCPADSLNRVVDICWYALVPDTYIIEDKDLL